MRQTGFTRASTLGPIADVVAARGGSISRVFRRADLPLELLAAPATPLPLRDHFCVLITASREVHDELFSARLGRQTTIENLGVFGKWVTQADCLHEAIARAAACLGPLLQSATRLVLRVQGRHASWSYELSDPATEGRQQNELLALSYMIAIVRHYAGPTWAPDTVIVGGRPVQSTGSLADLLQANVVFRDLPSGIVFDRTLLAAVEPSLGLLRSGLSAEDLDHAFDIPDLHDLVASVSALVAVELLGSHPTLPRISAKSGMSTRTLQRRLQANGVRLSDLVQGALQRRAAALLRDTDRPITEIAVSLGYDDVAHFSRAFRRWTGMPPSAWRKRH